MTTVSFCLTSDDNNYLRRFITAECSHDGDDWHIDRAVCTRMDVVEDGHPTESITPTNRDRTHWLRSWAKREQASGRGPRVQWIQDNGWPSERTQNLWDMLDLQAESDRETAVDAEHEQKVDQQREMYASPVYGAV